MWLTGERFVALTTSSQGAYEEEGSHRAPMWTSMLSRTVRPKGDTKIALCSLSNKTSVTNYSRGWLSIQEIDAIRTDGVKNIQQLDGYHGGGQWAGDKMPTHCEAAWDKEENFCFSLQAAVPLSSTQYIFPPSGKKNLRPGIARFSGKLEIRAFMWNLPIFTFWQLIQT